MTPNHLIAATLALVFTAFILRIELARLRRAYLSYVREWQHTIGHAHLVFRNPTEPRKYQRP